MLEANFAAGPAEPWFAELPPCRILQLHVTAPSAILLDRYKARVRSSERHAGHADIAALPEVERGLAEGRWRPLDLPGELIEVDTSSMVDVSALADVVRGTLL